MEKQKVYKFRGISDLHADEKGNFFYRNNPVPKVYNNGSMSVRIDKTKLGIKKLRALAYVSFIEKVECPF